MIKLKRVFGLPAVLLVGAIAPVAQTLSVAAAPQTVVPGGATKPRLLTQADPAEPPPPVPPRPEQMPDAQPPNSEGLLGASPDAETELGVGHLRPQNIDFLESPDWPSSENLDANWLQRVALPIYANPSGRHWGWLINGWLVPNQQPPIAIGQDAAFLMLQTYHALRTFPVMEIRSDGWFRFQYTPAGTAWAHTSHLDLGELSLTVETWQDRFLAAGWVQYRSHGASRPLRAEPTATDSDLVGLIGPESFIEPLAFEGDWMRVRVTQPTNGCEFLPGARTQEGWMRWRDEEGRSLIWFTPEGCQVDQEE